jgi:hypothetical protein
MTTNSVAACFCSPMVMQERENDDKQPFIIIFTPPILSSGKDGWGFFGQICDYNTFFNCGP